MCTGGFMTARTSTYLVFMMTYYKHFHLFFFPFSNRPPFHLLLLPPFTNLFALQFFENFQLFTDCLWFQTAPQKKACIKATVHSSSNDLSQSLAHLRGLVCNIITVSCFYVCGRGSLDSTLDLCL